MSLFSLFSVVVLAAEMIISPIPDNMSYPVTTFPAVSFGQISSKKNSNILGATTDPVVASPSAMATPSATVLRTSKRKHYTIALLGDSMIDTLGPDIPHLKKALTDVYPATTFTLHNFGVGATNIDYGLERIASGYSYLGKPVPSLISTRPDIVIVESFGYNPYPYEAGALDRHWLQLAAVVDSLRAHLPGVTIIIASTIAPNSKAFGDGAAGLAFALEDKKRRTDTIKSYLDSTVKFAKSQKLPLADVYHASLDSSGDGKLLYINGGDHIHYSEAGRTLFAQKITETILFSHLID